MGSDSDEEHHEVQCRTCSEAEMALEEKMLLQNGGRLVLLQNGVGQEPCCRRRKQARGRRKRRSNRRRKRKRRRTGRLTRMRSIMRCNVVHARKPRWHWRRSCCFRMVGVVCCFKMVLGRSHAAGEESRRKEARGRRKRRSDRRRKRKRRRTGRLTRMRSIMRCNVVH